MNLESILLLYLLDLDLRLPLNSVVALVFVESILFFVLKLKLMEHLNIRKSTLWIMIEGVEFHVYMFQRIVGYELRLNIRLYTVILLFTNINYFYLFQSQNFDVLKNRSLSQFELFIDLLDLDFGLLLNSVVPLVFCRISIYFVLKL